jgi:hypothetical protein
MDVARRAVGLLVVGAHAPLEKPPSQRRSTRPSARISFFSSSDGKNIS